MYWLLLYTCILFQTYIVGNPFCHQYTVLKDKYLRKSFQVVHSLSVLHCSFTCTTIERCASAEYTQQNQTCSLSYVIKANIKRFVEKDEDLSLVVVNEGKFTCNMSFLTLVILYLKYYSILLCKSAC